MFDCFDVSIPKYKIRHSSGTVKYPTWFSIDLVRANRLKNRLHRKVMGGKVDAAECNRYYGAEASG